ncbi:MAG TPA: hypothetical protein VF727_06085 [Allosphingosinicella sp.]
MAALHHRTFWSDPLLERPETLTDAQLRRILAWGKLIHRPNSTNPKGAEIEHRMRLALDELRRRRGVE